MERRWEREARDGGFSGVLEGVYKEQVGKRRERNEDDA